MYCLHLQKYPISGFQYIKGLCIFFSDSPLCVLVQRLYKGFKSLLYEWSTAITRLFCIHLMADPIQTGGSSFCIQFLARNRQHIDVSNLLSKAPVTLTRFKPRFTTTHSDLRQIVKSGCIGMEKKKFQHQYDVSRCSYGV